MLDESKKSLIEAEERYRHEIAKKISDEATIVEKDIETSSNQIWAKIYDILNSNVGMLILSSVLISGGAAFYQNMQHNYESRVTSQKEIISCEFEIANRLYVVKNLISHAKTVGDALEALTGAKKSLGPVKPEFQNVGLAVLYFNLYQLTGNRNPSVEQDLREIERVYFSLQEQDPKAIFNEADKEAMTKIFNELFELNLKDIHHLK
ncbi:hypothetical protein G6652_09655 [Polynucleobacter paneuropaeus]|jgi:hypothetical protein|nr:hypothetical protein [Polynucleobacter paneuropaeus]MBT8522451.1 hypothetical protein [Polynucleobacter paneuropaeus]MBT8537985.1 hypothetical protein [Polynucleobacter paneuropaeus]MBT8615612.1 hypothetical protein [Polynucleobacter paneuropaeus]MBT8617491.1 hypothetical protein [Polynucleobacter paneuropaeus]MBT8619373.1 hypothetical protein [Polynucleobacter paneuropaeus]